MPFLLDLHEQRSQFLNGLAPLVENGTMPFAIAKEMMLVITRRYNFGSNLEDILQAVEEPPKPEAGEDPAAKAEAEALQMEAGLRKQEAEQKMTLGQQEFQQKKELMALELQIEQAQLQIKKEEIELQRQGLIMKAQAAAASHKQKMEAIAAKPVKEKVDG